MVRPTGELVPDWTCPALVDPQNFDSIEDFALSPSGFEAYVAGDFTVSLNGLRSDGIFRLNLADGVAESLEYLNPPTSGIKQVDLRPDGALVILEMPSQGGELWIHPDPTGGVGDFFRPGDSSPLQMYNIACFTLLKDGRLLAVGEFTDPEAERDFSQALFSSVGHYLPDAFGQSIRVWPHETRARLAGDGSVWMFGDFDMELATSDTAAPAWEYAPTQLTRWVELMPPPATSPIQVVLGETNLHSQDGQTTYISLLRTGATEALDTPLDGDLETVWSVMSPELHEHEDYIFPGTRGAAFEFQAFERLVSIPVTFLTDNELAHQNEGGRIAAFAPDYAGAPFPDSTSTNQRTQVQIDVADASVDKLTALQVYFPEITDLYLTESQLDPDEDGHDSLTEILMRTDPRTPDPIPQLKLFRRMHPQDAQAVWVLELPFDGTLEQGHFEVRQSDTSLGEPLHNWQAFAENNHLMSDQRHRATNERETLLYGDPHGKGIIGLKLDPGVAGSAFWEALYLSF